MRIFKIANSDILTGSEKYRNLNQSNIFSPSSLEEVRKYKEDWLKRHEYKYLKDGKWTFYHGSPKSTIRGKMYLQKGSLLAGDIEDAIHYATRDRGLKASSVIVFQLALEPNEFNAGIFPSIDKDIPINSSNIKIVH